MARPWRIEYPDAVYHVTSRGNRGQDIFFDDPDRRDFLDLTGRASARFRIRVLAFCLMSNHYHLFLRTPEGNLSLAMKWLNATYTSHVNRRHSLSGHLFQGRYKSVLVTDDAHWLHLSMYIHLNPVRAGIVEDPAQYEWSSFRDYIRPKPRFEWLDNSDILERYRGKGSPPRRRYKKEAIMLSGKGAHFWQDFRDRLVIGSNETIRSLLRTNPPAGKPQSVPQFTSLARSQVDVDKELDRLCKAFAVSRQELRLKKRNGIPRMAAYFHLVENCGLSVAETASKLEVGSSAVSNGISKLRQLMSSDNYLEKKIKSLSVK